jgi:hypothetical protein
MRQEGVVMGATLFLARERMRQENVVVVGVYGYHYLHPCTGWKDPAGGVMQTNINVQSLFKLVSCRISSDTYTPF